jgi:hypothetical protein
MTNSGSPSPKPDVLVYARMAQHSTAALREAVQALRELLERSFAQDTAAPGFPRSPESPASTGHCAAVALIAHACLGADIVSATVQSESHWFNRIVTNEGPCDFDLTSDQFGLPSVCIDEAGRLHRGTRIRDLSEANRETVARARLLARRAGLPEVDQWLGRCTEGAASTGRDVG